MQFTHLIDRPIIHVSDADWLEGNVNGPSLIRVPNWVANPLGNYYLYFAHHEGKSIRLAFADDLMGDWQLYPQGALQLRDSLFPEAPPKEEDLTPEVKAMIARGDDGYYPHVASPDVIIDHEKRQIRLYYHGRIKNGEQHTRVALSTDGLNFTPRDELLGRPYMRMFEHNQVWYGIGMPGILYRAEDGLTNFIKGQTVLPPKVRHTAVLKQGTRLLVFWSQVGDAPEHILVSEIDLIGDWRTWQATNHRSVHKPMRGWEGATRPNLPSRYGESMEPVNQLRDPAIFVEDAAIYLLYSIAGEQGIGIGRLDSL